MMIPRSLYRFGLEDEQELGVAFKTRKAGWLVEPC